VIIMNVVIILCIESSFDMLDYEVMIAVLMSTLFQHILGYIQ